MKLQTLTMPFTRCMMLCGFKNPAYKAHWKYDHYGVDLSTIQGKASDDPRILASGIGTVLACGFDNSGGNVVVVHYPDVHNHKTGEVKSLIARYMHLASIAVQAGNKVERGHILGVEGNTKTGDHHLHLELDTDCKFPLYTPQVSGWDDAQTVAQGNILKKGTDTTVNPSFVLCLGTGQQIVKPTYNPAWLNPEDFIIPQRGIGWETEAGEPATDWEQKYKELAQRVKDSKASYEQMGKLYD